jgi:8-oxo-dGTP pyrophosphatase MutT (NUDIX family)
VSVDQYKVLDSTPRYTGRIISLRTDEVEMSDGVVSRREVVEHPGAVAIVALDPEDKVVMVRQYRHPVGEYLDELPAGILDVDGESAVRAAQRELHEESALTAGRWDVLIDLYASPGMSDEAIRVFLARDLLPVPEQDRFVPEHEEITMTVSRVPLSAAVDRVLAGQIVNSIAVAGILAAEAARARGWVGLRPSNSDWSARPGR